MVKIRLAAITIAVVIFGFLLISPASAQYGPCSVDLDVDEDSFSGQAESNVDGGTFDIFNDYNGQTESGGNPTNFNFSSPDDEDEVTITAVYTIVGGSSCQSSVTIELDDGDGDEDGDGDDNGDEDKNGGLPDTGGSDRTTILAGLTLVLVGGSVVYLSRRRNADTA